MTQDNIGVVTEVFSTQAKIKVESSSVPTSKHIEAWNSVSAQVGERVYFAEQKGNKIYFMMLGIPLIAIVAGVLFGGNIAVYFKQDIQMGRIVGGVIWFLLSVIYIIPFRKNFDKNKNKRFVVTKIKMD